MIDFTQFDSLLQVADYFTTNDICKQAIAEARWADGVAVCPYCGGRHCKVGKDGRYLCKDCNRKFNVTVGTIFENTKLPLRKWFMAMYLISSNKKGVSSCQIMRDINVTQKTSWFLLHKIRGLYGITDAIALDGEVEMDEMYLGGREINKHESKKTEGTQGRSTKTKTPIFGMIQRGGNVVAMKVDDTVVQPHILTKPTSITSCLRTAMTICSLITASVSSSVPTTSTPTVSRAFGDISSELSSPLTTW